MFGTIFLVTVPDTIIRSAWRGVARNSPAPKRSMSKREAAMQIISMAQHASPNCTGQMDDLRPQLYTSSSMSMTLPKGAISTLRETSSVVASSSFSTS